MDIAQQFVDDGKVYLKTAAGPMEIKRTIYQEEPPVLEQCSACSHAMIYEVNPDPSRCAIAKDVRTEFVLCRVAVGRPYESGVCDAYTKGVPKRPLSLKTRDQNTS